MISNIINISQKCLFINHGGSMIYKVVKSNNCQEQGTHDSLVFTSIQAAVNQACYGDVIEIGPGVYKEKLSIIISGISLIGQDRAICKLTYDDYANKDYDDGSKYGTFRSYTCLIQADQVTLKNLTIENSAGDGRKVGQGVALYARGDKLSIVDTDLIGHQDTLFAGPLPEEARILGSFLGPTYNLPYRTCRQYYENVTIIGDVDFIFGSALAVFHKCKLVSRNRKEKINSFVTAPSTWKHEPYGFVFLRCEFTGDEGIENESVYLGRPWRPYGQVMVVACCLSPMVHKDYWHPWGNEKNFETARLLVHDREEELLDMLDKWHLNKLKEVGLNIYE